MKKKKAEKRERKTFETWVKRKLSRKTFETQVKKRLSGKNI